MIIALRTLAQQLGFDQVENLVELQGEACHFDMEDLEDPHVWNLVTRTNLRSD